MKRLLKKKMMLKMIMIQKKDVEELVESDDVADNVHEYDIDDDILIVTNIDDDDDMANTYNVESVSGDTDDEVHWSVWGMT